MEAAEVELRREAARRRLAGESPRAIARDLGRTRQRVAKWAGRRAMTLMIRAGRGAGRGRRGGWPTARPAMSRRGSWRSGCGWRRTRGRRSARPPAIARELEKLGAVVPPLRTFERIRKRAGATERQRPGRRVSKRIAYPAPAAERPGDVVQVDLVGPRHLDGGGRFHALNQIDVASHQAGIEIVADRADARVIPAGWPACGRVEFIRFIRSDHKLRLLGRAIAISSHRQRCAGGNTTSPRVNDPLAAVT